jgi:hypothetical protein
VPASAAEVSPLLSEDGPGAHVVELASGVVAFETAKGQHDVSAYARLAGRAADVFGSAVVVVCELSYPHQAAQVFRRGCDPHAFAMRSSGPRDAESQHFAGIGQSWVASPLVDGLALAGLNGRELAVELCKRLGQHEHPGRDDGGA